MFYICTKSRENILKGFRVIERTLFLYRNLQNDIKNIILEIIQMESRFLSSAHNLSMFYMCTKFRENTLKGFRIVEQTRFSH